ncbi:hypothetical protein BC936DRAFT_146231 [Jimgerdemannia flammicorona]|uniref:Uncharacterized protein n=1 Tax=Jimgerdemannia flammicorona TaxID=994334 RepID=A0A433D8T0_9FUNG|nr:hypothetical protein BC936DRAFT_146231 [Jimgerdemannia flammicorona]
MRAFALSRCTYLGEEGEVKNRCTLGNFSLDNATITTLPMSISNFNATELLNLFTCTTCNANMLGVFNKRFKNHTDILPSNLTLGLSEVELAVNSKCGSSWAATANGSSTTTTSTNSATGGANIASSFLVYKTVVASVVVAIVNILFL